MVKKTDPQRSCGEATVVFEEVVAAGTRLVVVKAERHGWVTGGVNVEVEGETED